MDGTHWGAIAAGVGGIATAGALFVSLVLLGQQMREQRRARIERYREHASNVSFWVELNRVDPEHGVVEILAHIRNTSNRPAMSPRVEVGLRNYLWWGRPHIQVTDKWTAAAIGPRDDITHGLSLTGLPESLVRKVEEDAANSPIGELFFFDAAGLGWVRMSDGRLFRTATREWSSVVSLSLADRERIIGWGRQRERRHRIRLRNRLKVSNVRQTD